MLVSIIMGNSEKTLEFLRSMGYKWRLSPTSGIVVRVDHTDAPSFLKLMKESDIKGRYL